MAPPEACWRLFSFKMHKNYPAVMVLDLHCEHENFVTFNVDKVTRQIKKELTHAGETQLTALFKYNHYYTNHRWIFAEDSLNPLELKYDEFPQFFTWNPRTKHWHRRTKIQKEPTVGRIHPASPTAGERYYLRLLLTIKRGGTFFNDMKQCLDNVVYSTFKETCVAMGLTEDYKIHIDAMKDTALYASPANLRFTFVLLLLNCELSNLVSLFSQFLHDMTEYWSYHNPSLSLEDLQNQCLHEINRFLSENEKSLKDFDLPEPILQTQKVNAWDPIDKSQLWLDVKRNTQIFNAEQRTIFDLVTQSVFTNNKANTNTYFFLDAPGGTVKTFVANTILAAVRKDGRRAIAVASSGIAAILLDGGRTAHSQFGIPLDCGEQTISSIKKNLTPTILQLQLQETDLIIWDEAPMMNKYVFGCVDRLMRDMKGNNKLFGGVTVLLCGDFRQVLPVEPRASRAKIISLCLTNAYF